MACEARTFHGISTRSPRQGWRGEIHGLSIRSPAVKTGAFYPQISLRTHIINGDDPGDKFGVSVSGAGDVNSDGYHDFIISSLGEGRAYVFSGEDGSLLFTTYGARSVSDAGDINGDGHADIITSNGNGYAYVVSGINGSIFQVLTGVRDDFFGWSVSGAGDVNGDSVPDLIVGAPYDDDNGLDSGSATVFSGSDGSILYTFYGGSAGDQLGRSVSDAGDVNNDGYADVVVGAWLDDENGNMSGSAFVYSGFDGSVLYTFLGYSEDSYFGNTVSGARDINNDGYSDVIVGAIYERVNNVADVGTARVFSGADGSVLLTLKGEDPSQRFGAEVSDVGDVDGDTIPDLIIGSREPNDTGSASVFSGIDGSLLFTVYGNSVNDNFGVSVSGVGDVDGDGFSDLIAGATYDDNNGEDSGSACVFSAAPVRLTKDLLNYVLENLPIGLNQRLVNKLEDV